MIVYKRVEVTYVLKHRWSKGKEHIKIPSHIRLDWTDALGRKMVRVYPSSAKELL